MGEKIPLGSAAQGITKSEIEPQTAEERLQVLEKKLEAMSIAFYETRAVLADKENSFNAYLVGTPVATNKDGVPLNTSYIGIVDGIPYILTVKEDGNYYIGNIQYTSLSSAAAAVGAPNRKSGWRFWKAADGTSMKQLYRT